MNVLALTPIAPEVPTGAGPNASVEGDAGEFEALLDRTIRGDGDPSGAPAEDTTEPTETTAETTTESTADEVPAGEATAPELEAGTPDQADPTTADGVPAAGAVQVTPGPASPTANTTPAATGEFTETATSTGAVVDTSSEASTTAPNLDGATPPGDAGSDLDAPAAQGALRTPGTTSDGTAPRDPSSGAAADAATDTAADTPAAATVASARSGSQGTGTDAQLPDGQPADETAPATRDATSQSTGQSAGTDAAGIEAPTALHRTGGAAAAGTPEGTALGERLLQMQELVDAAQATLRHRGAERLVVELHPAELGAVTIDLRLDGQAVNVSMRATNPAAVERLLAELTQLRQDLAAAGVDVGDVDVRTGTQGRAPDRDDSARTGAELRRPASAPSDSTATERRHLLGTPIPTNGRLAVDL